jgi:hypothetical protein
LERIVNLKFAVPAAIFLLTNGCALVEPVNPPAPKDQQAPAASPAGRTQEEVRAEAVEAAKHHKSTLSEDLNFFQR